MYDVVEGPSPTAASICAPPFHWMEVGSIDYFSGNRVQFLARPPVVRPPLPSV